MPPMPVAQVPVGYKLYSKAGYRLSKASNAPPTALALCQEILTILGRISRYEGTLTNERLKFLG